MSIDTEEIVTETATGSEVETATAGEIGTAIETAVALAARIESIEVAIEIGELGSGPRRQSLMIPLSGSTLGGTFLLGKFQLFLVAFRC